jgi:protein TonB
MTSSKESPVNPQLPERTETASLSRADQLKGSKVDYGWLANAMAQWIEGLDKRYPAILRTEGVQGKVTLIAMLHDNGTLSDIRVTTSSGNIHLDDVAVEDVKNGPPVRLSRLLDRPQMPVRFSIVYDLRTTP